MKPRRASLAWLGGAVLLAAVGLIVAGAWMPPAGLVTTLMVIALLLVFVWIG